MSKAVSILGLLASLGILFASYTISPETADAGSGTETSLSDGCIAREVALDEGYGVSRTEMRLVCADK